MVTKIKVNSRDSFYKIADTLCETTVKNQREPGNLTYHADDQHWHIVVTSYEDATVKKNIMYPFSEEGDRRIANPIQIVPTDSQDVWIHHNDNFLMNRYREVLPCETKVGTKLLKKGSVLLFDYDQTERFLQVHNVRRLT
jgi:DNA-binding transcriptional regulator PaaX